MLKDKTDFDYNMSELKKDLNINITLQDDVMESEKMNTSLKSIENNLNVLYEKTRYLEDAIDYAKTFLTMKIDNYINDINSSIKSIEDLSTVDKNLGYIDYNVPFIENTTEEKDRNKNYKITPCSIKNNVLTLSNRIKDTYNYSSITYKCEQVPHYNNLSTISTDGFYRSIYLEEKPVKTGIVETITIYLEEPKEVNELNITPVNCNVKNIRYVYINGIEEQAGDLVTGIELESRIVTHIKFDIECTAYNTIEYTLDKDKVSTDNLWNKIKELEYPVLNSKDKIDYESVIRKVEYNSTTKNITTTNYRKDSANELKVVMYAYNFGLDSLEVNRVVLYKNNYFLSDPITIGDMDESEYLQLFVNDNTGVNSSIEYYVTDGNLDIPILPIGTDYVYNEKIFPETDLRFTESDDLETFYTKTIKKDGIELPISLEEAKLKYDGVYCVSYSPMLDNTYRPLNNTIRIKAVIRTFGDVYDTIPYINMINIRKFGGNALWTNLY